MRGTGWKKPSVLFAVAASLTFLPSAKVAQAPTWQDLKKAAEEAGQKGEFARENQLVEAAIAQAEKSFGPYDRRLAAALKELVVLGSPIGNPNEEAAARDRIRMRILQIDERNLGPDDPEVAADLVAVASNYPLDDDKTAQPLFERALKIYQQTGITEDTGLLDIYYTLANRAYFRREYAQAEAFYRKALVISENVPHGCENSVLQSLARTYVTEGKPREAEQLYLDSVAEAQTKSPADRCIEWRLQTLADFYVIRGQMDQAETTLKWRVALAQKTWGATDLRVVASLNGLGDFYRKRKSPGAALRAYQQGLAIIQHRAEPENESFLAGRVQTFARYLQELERYGEAETYYKWAVAIYGRLGLDESRSGIASVWREMAGLYVQQGRREEAEELLMDALAFDEEYSPPVSMAALGDLEMLESKIYLPQRRYSEVEKVIRRQMALRETQYGPNSAPVADLLDRLSVVLEKLNRTDEARQTRAKAKAILRSLGQIVGD